MPASYPRPGVRVEAFAPAVEAEFRTGVAGFLAPAVAIDGGAPPSTPDVRLYASWHDFAYDFTTRQAGTGTEQRTIWRQLPWRPDELVWNAVQGFFGNGGVRCQVVFYNPAATGDRGMALASAVMALADTDVDVVCAPALAASADRGLLLAKLFETSERCRAERDASWFILVDTLPPGAGEDLAAWVDAARGATPRPFDAAVYHPWLVLGGEFEPCPRSPGQAVSPAPPCGHIAGVFARSDRRAGVHRAPANEELLGVVDLAGARPELPGVNPIDVFPGRGIRVWGARTLAPLTSAANAGPDHFVNVRRLVLMFERWLVRALEWAVFEPNDLRLWVRIQRELEDRLTNLFLHGAFQGKTPDEAFRIKCDAENNPADQQASGRLQVDVQIAPAAPQEFIAIRLVRSAEGLAIA